MKTVRASLPTDYVHRTCRVFCVLQRLVCVQSEAVFTASQQEVLSTVTLLGAVVSVVSTCIVMFRSVVLSPAVPAECSCLLLAAKTYSL